MALAAKSISLMAGYDVVFEGQEKALKGVWDIGAILILFLVTFTFAEPGYNLD